MKYSPLHKAIGVAVTCIAVYGAGYYHGSESVTNKVSPKLTELQAKANQTTSLLRGVNYLGKRITSLEELVKLKNEQLATPVTVNISQVAFSQQSHVGKFEVTAYSPYDDRNYINSDGNPNNTATGTKPKPGTFAVDPEVIPYGSKITIIYPNGTTETGTAEDTGGAINKNHIDVFRYTYDAAISFGRQEAIVIWNTQQ